MSNGIRDVLAIDGEGRDLPGTGTEVRIPYCVLATREETYRSEWENCEHMYTLLNAYDSKVGKQRYIENAERGLSTWEILDFLLWLRCGKGTICCAYFFNYDVAMWLKDIPDAQKSVLWKSGQLVASAPHGRLYYLHYIPAKLFFVGAYAPEMGVHPDEYNYHGRHLRIYDVSGFAQRSFVKALSEWDIALPGIAEMKAQRGTFTAQDAQRVRSYCQAECKALAEYVQKLDATFQDEDIRLNSWYGGGALAAFFMKRERVAQHVKDPETPEAYHSVLSAYFGGRTEICTMGHLRNALDYDISSAYPAASLYVPELATGTWQYTTGYDVSALYALWHVSWDTRQSGRRLGPLPFRYKKGVYYPDVGSGWVHACELSAARRYFGGRYFSIDTGWVYLGGGDSKPGPFAFVADLAVRRVGYKYTDYRRSVPYKYGLNSIYGKLAQHAVDEGKLPPYQCYYAAGLITAYTRAQLLSFIYEGGHDESDIVMLATDGVFCTESRSWHVQSGEREELGRFGRPVVLEDAYFIQPGCWYARDGMLRSRGFGAKSLDYRAVGDAYRRGGVHGYINFQETRFVGLGTCAGRGDYRDYARWIRDARTLSYYPDRKYVAPGYTGGEECVPLVPYSFPGLESEQYVPASLRDTHGYVENLTELLQILYAEDQPDIGDE